MRRTPGKVGSRDCLRGNLEPIPRCKLAFPVKCRSAQRKIEVPVIPSSGNRVNTLRLI